MAQCPTPFKPNGTEYNFPCGTCLVCKQRRASGWGFRLSQQGRASSATFFVTYTYNSDHVPITKNGFLTLQKEKFRLNFKRVRQRYYRYVQHQHGFARGYKMPSDGYLKYYTVGEYGGLKHRPHYHQILFNAPLEFLVGKKWARIAMTNREFYLKGKFHYTAPEIWPYGTITIGEVNYASINYALKYISKDRKAIPIHARDDRQKEFAAVSKGIGSTYINAQSLRWHYADLFNRCYLTIDGGVKIAIPRYLKERIYDQDMLIDIAAYNKQKDEDYLAGLTHKKRGKIMTNRQAAGEVNYRKLQSVRRRDKNDSVL